MVKYPNMRDELIETLQDLSDVEYQRRTWVNHEFPEGIQFDCFDNSIHLLLGDMSLITNPERSLGSVVENEVELNAVRKVALAIDHMLKKLGNEATDAEYINDPEWSEVINTSSEALRIIEGRPKG
jgi:hypothetical protein